MVDYDSSLDIFVFLPTIALWHLQIVPLFPHYFVLCFSGVSENFTLLFSNFFVLVTELSLCFCGSLEFCIVL